MDIFWKYQLTLDVEYNDGFAFAFSSRLLSSHVLKMLKNKARFHIMGKMNLTRVCLYFFGFTKVSVVAPCFLSTSKNRCRCFKWEERVKWAAWSYSFQYNTFLLFFFLKRKDFFSNKRYFIYGWCSWCFFFLLTLICRCGIYAFPVSLSRNGA